MQDAVAMPKAQMRELSAPEKLGQEAHKLGLQACFLHTPVPKSTLFLTRPKNSAEIEPWGAPMA